MVLWLIFVIEIDYINPYTTIEPTVVQVGSNIMISYYLHLSLLWKNALSQYLKLKMIGNV